MNKPDRQTDRQTHTHTHTHTPHYHYEHTTTTTTATTIIRPPSLTSYHHHLNIAHHHHYQYATTISTSSPSPSAHNHYHQQHTTTTIPPTPTPSPPLAAHHHDYATRTTTTTTTTSTKTTTVKPHLDGLRRSGPGALLRVVIQQEVLLLEPQRPSVRLLLHLAGRHLKTSQTAEPDGGGPARGHQAQAAVLGQVGAVQDGDAVVFMGHVQQAVAPRDAVQVDGLVPHEHVL